MSVCDTAKYSKRSKHELTCNGASQIVWICMAADSMIEASDCIKFNTPPEPRAFFFLSFPNLESMLLPPPGNRRLLSKIRPSSAPLVWVDMVTTLWKNWFSRIILSVRTATNDIAASIGVEAGRASPASTHLNNRATKMDGNA